LYGVALPQGFDDNKVVFSILIYCVFNICGYYIGKIQILNKWYQSTFLGKHCGQIFFIFADFFFQKKKEGRALSKFLVYFCEKFVEKGCISEFLSYKHPI
jgi:hypothetical protein